MAGHGSHWQFQLTHPKLDQTHSTVFDVAVVVGLTLLL